ncbi:hypothetical protein V6N12_025003 [Hibiscus sabdariffa]|uniref:Uncharacterized protein n=1 Tax=Hibiscus sabdariffa TaxID=183260 RepID=A0ABR1ZYL5_9ROSI
MEENSDRAFGDGVDALAEAEGITISLTVLPPRVDPRHQVRFRSLFNIVVTEVESLAVMAARRLSSKGWIFPTTLVPYPPEI